MLNIYLPGMSAKNQEECKSFKEAFEAQGQAFYGLNYRHWSESEFEFDFEYELEICKKILTDNFSSQINLICKSIGTAIGAKALYEEKITPNKLVLMGIPSGPLKEFWDFYKSAIQTAGKVLILLNEKDPYVDQYQVSQLVEGNINVTWEVIEGIDNHRYFYAERVLSFFK